MPSFVAPDRPGSRGGNVRAIKGQRVKCHDCREVYISTGRESAPARDGGRIHWNCPTKGCKNVIDLKIRRQ